MVPTVDLGLTFVVFWSIEIAGDNYKNGKIIH